MKTRQPVSCFISLSLFAVVGSNLPAQAQTVDISRVKGVTQNSLSSAQSVPIPGTTATAAAAFIQMQSPPSQVTKSVADVNIPWLAQADTTPVPSPGTGTTQSPADVTPTPTSPTAPPVSSPGTGTTQSPADVTPTPTTTVNFSDIDPNYWAYPFIQGLVARNAIAGFPDGTFKPEQPVTRAEFAAMIQKTFNPNPVGQPSSVNFSDVPANYWAAAAIRSAYEGGFMEGYPNNLFQPNQEIPKVQAITSLARGLNLTPGNSTAEVLNTYYTDAAQIPPYATTAVAAATQANVVVNYPDVKTLNPLTPVTRAEAAAHLYQALVQRGQIQPIPSTVAAANYIVGRPAEVAQTPTTPTETAPPTTQETAPNPETNVEPGRTTRGGSSYFGVAGNFGLTGDTGLGDTNFAVLSKIGLTRSISARPAVVIEDDPTILIPLTYDFSFQREDALGERFSIAPYLGAGVGITTGDGADVGFLLSGGIDVPLTSRFTATAGVNAIFKDDTDVGILVGIGYNFAGF